MNVLPRRRVMLAFYWLLGLRHHPFGDARQLRSKIDGRAWALGVPWRHGETIAHVLGNGVLISHFLPALRTLGEVLARLCGGTWGELTIYERRHGLRTQVFDRHGFHSRREGNGVLPQTGSSFP